MTTFDDKLNPARCNACEDCLLLEALKIAVQEGMVTVSMLHQRLAIGFSRAGRLVELLEEHGFIGPQNGPGPRRCLLARLPEESVHEEQLMQAAVLAVQEREISVSYLQRRLALGYARAGWLVDKLVERGVIERSATGLSYVCRVTSEELADLMCETKND